MLTHNFTYTVEDFEEAALPASTVSHQFERLHYIRHFQGDLVGTGVPDMTVCVVPSPEGRIYSIHSGILHFKGTVQGVKGDAVFVIYGSSLENAGLQSVWLLDARTANVAFESLWGKGEDHSVGNGFYGGSLELEVATGSA